MPRMATGADAGRALAAARQKLRLSQAEFANRLSESAGRSIHSTQLSKWERGRFRPPYDVLVGAARLAGVSLDDLLEAGPRPGAPAVGAAPQPDARRMLLDLLEIGFSLPEAIELVKRSTASRGEGS